VNRNVRAKNCSKTSDKARRIYNVNVKAKSILSSAVAVFLMIAGFASQAQAAQIDASRIPEFDRAAGSFVGVEFVQMTYEPGSAAAKLFDGRTERIEFSVEGMSARGMSELVPYLLHPTLLAGKTRRLRVLDAVG
jgi:hypothetical protein